MGRIWVVSLSVILLLAVCAGVVALAWAGSVDKLLHLEQYRSTAPAGAWPQPGSIVAYA